MTTAPRRLGKYELRQQVGRGNVGEVWKAYDLQAHRNVAVKIIHPDLQSDPHFLSHFTQEGQRLCALQHENIVQVYEIATSRTSQESTGGLVAYIATDFVEGQTLADYIAQTSHKGLYPSPSEIVYLFSSLGIAIDYAHQQGIVHGNIKPTNILLNANNTQRFIVGEPMLTDFALDSLLGNSSSVVSPLYISPEQVKGQVANNRSDIYALGVILYELCTGVRPFRDSSSVAIMMQHADTLPTPPLLINPTIPAALSEVILRAMAKDTAARFPLASLLATAIADAYALPSNITGAQRAINRETEEAYHSTTGPQGTILGVSQPLPKLPARDTSLSRPLPPVSQPLPTVSGKQPVVRPVQPAAHVPTTTGKQPTQSMKTPPVQPQGSAGKVAAISTSSGQTPIVTTAKMPVSSLTGPTHRLPVTQPTQPTPQSPPYVSPPAPKKYWRRDMPVYTIIAILVVLLLIVLGSIGLNLFLHGTGTTVGHVFFQDDALGHDDTLRVELQNIATPAQDKNAVIWLQENGQTFMPLGTLNVQNGASTFLYNGNAKHTNILASIQRIIVTDEDRGAVLKAPKGNTLYTAQFDSASFPYLKNILYATPGLPPNKGVVSELIDAIKSIDDKAVSIVDSLQNTHDYPLVGRQATRIIEIIDGTALAVSSGDQPVTYPSMMNRPVGLLSSPQQKGYLDTLAAQLDQLQPATTNNATQQQHIQHVRSAIADLQSWLQKMRGYDVQLLKAAHLNDPALIGVALQLKQVTADSYTGRTIPPNAGPQPVLGSAGAYQAYTECQYMATLDVKRA